MLVLTLFAWCLIIIESESFPSNIHTGHVLDLRLCNNAPSAFSYNTTRDCRSERDGKLSLCDERTISNKDCQGLTFLMSMFTSDALTQLVPTVDSDLSIRRIHIKLTTPMQLIDYDQLGNEIDRFLLTRPWWYVSKEPYAWHEHRNRSNSIIIDRVQHGIEKSLFSGVFINIQPNTSAKRLLYYLERWICHTLAGAA